MLNIQFSNNELFDIDSFEAWINLILYINSFEAWINVIFYIYSFVACVSLILYNLFIMNTFCLFSSVVVFYVGQSGRSFKHEFKNVKYGLATLTK